MTKEKLRKKRLAKKLRRAKKLKIRIKTYGTNESAKINILTKPKKKKDNKIKLKENTINLTPNKPAVILPQVPARPRIVNEPLPATPKMKEVPEGLIARLLKFFK